MVQLKASMAVGSITSTNISIPYGSIKRHMSFAKLEELMDFNSLWFN